MKNFSIPFVLTKFGNSINDICSKMEVDGYDTSDYDMLIHNVQASIDHFKKEIQGTFLNP